MIEERRMGDVAWGDTARILAVLYIVGFLAFVGGLFIVPIPAGNKELILTIAGIMSTVQSGVIGYYFGSSKSAENSQRTMAASKDKADSALQELAKVPADIKTNGVKVTAQKADIKVGAKEKR